MILTINLFGMSYWIIAHALIIIGMLYLAFFKSYFSEKGKRLALKDDIDEVTQRVEAIRDKFTKEQEVVKIELQRILNNNISYREEERNAIIKFHGIISEWLFTILEVKYNSVGWSAIEYISSCRNNIDTFYAKAGMARAKVELLVEDKELVNKAYQLYSGAIEFNGWTGMEFLKLQTNLERQRNLNTRLSDLFSDMEKNNAALRKLAEDEKLIESERESLCEHYHANRNSEYLKVKVVEEVFVTSVKEYLKK